MNIKRMLGHNYQKDTDYLRFKYYGDFDTMKWIADDCKADLEYIGNSNLDGAPVFIYTFHDINVELLKDFKQLNVHLRELKIRKYTKKDLTKEEQSILTFFNFFMNSDQNMLIKGVSTLEIKKLFEEGYEED